MTPQRIQRRRTKDWRMPENAVYVGRGSRWGNPFGISRGGYSIIGPPWFEARANWGPVTAAGMTAAYVSSSRGIVPAEVVEQYRMLLKCRRRDEPERFAQWIQPLIGKNLACWCQEGHSCHADVLLELANGGDQ